MNKSGLKILAVFSGFFLVAAASGAVFYFIIFNGRHQQPAGIKPAIKNEATKKETAVKSGLASPLQPAKNRAPLYNGESPHILNGDAELEASVGRDFLDKYKKILEKAAARLDRNPQSYDDWITVAYVKKLFKNYTGARDALEYAKVVFPEYPLAYFNLATLYGFYLREPALAEPNYVSSIQKNRTDVNQYIGFADFYRMVAKEPPKAEAVILDGLKYVPNDMNMVIYLASFYRDRGDKAQAIIWFKKALSLGAGGEQKQTIEEELGKLSQ